MTNLKDKCHLKIAEETIGSKDLREHFKNMGKGVVSHLPDDVITKADRQLIKAEIVDEEATRLIKEALLKSVVQEKMDIFLEELEKSEGVRARKIRDVYKRYKKEHKCEHCGLPTPQPAKREDGASGSS